MTERLSNTELGGLLGISHASVSRIRSGHRNPSIAVMSKIATLTGWEVGNQIEARGTGTYPEEFEEAVSRLDLGSLVPAQRSE